MRVLSHDEARAFYDWFGARQDYQRFYEDPALADLIAHANFGASRSVFEFGCGTGRLAERLLRDWLPPDCGYLATDISSTMVRLARERLAPWRDRAEIMQSSGAIDVPTGNATVDRFIVCYVLDLLGDSDMRRVLAEARRVLMPGGLLCVVSLTRGTSLPAKISGAMWRMLFRLQPKLVGGCRPIDAAAHLDGTIWSVCYDNVVTRFGLSSEILIARATTDQDAGTI